MTSAIAPVEVLTALTPFLNELHGIVDAAMVQSLETFGPDPVDRDHLCNLVRYRIRLSLTEGADELGIEQVILPNNGIEVRVLGYRVKVLKSRHGLPAPARTVSRRSFYHQPSLFGHDHEQELAVKLVVLWEETAEHVFTGLLLGCPQLNSDEILESPHMHWVIPVPHPAAHGSVGHPSIPPQDLDDIGLPGSDEDWEDLDINVAGDE